MMTHNIIIRQEVKADYDAVHAVNVATFARLDEAQLVDRLRKNVSPCISLVAERNGDVVGHIFFTPVRVECDDEANWNAMALGPMAVIPKYQRQGIGGRLIHEGLKHCAAMETPAVFVLGHPDYYPRFGFEPASKYGCRCQWDVPDDVFMVLKLSGAPLRSGLVRYHAEFETVA